MSLYNEVKQMTYKELNSLFYIRKRIKQLRRRIIELTNEDGLKGANYDGMPHGSGVSSPVENIALKKAELIEQYNATLETEIRKEKEISAYIEAVEDSEIKLIMELRFLRFMTYEQIAAEIHLERTTVSKKLRNYLKDSR